MSSNMMNIIISNFLIIAAVLAICGWILVSVCVGNSPQTFNSTILLSNQKQETAKVAFVLSNKSNILRSSLNGDKSATSLNHSLTHKAIAIPPTYDTDQLKQIKQTLLEIDEISVNNIISHPVLGENIKIPNNFDYGINKSNQENNSKNILKQPAPLLSNIKLVNSSNLSPSSLPSSPVAIAARFRPTNSKFTASPYFERVEMHESLIRSKSEKLLLHRNKRYLLFPEGSSFQLVFDLIIPIVDYTNFAIMGITCAVAWELPSEPPSEIIENFRTKLNEGTFGISRRNDSMLQPLIYTNSKRTEQQDKKRLREGITEVHNHNLLHLSATAATTSGREHFLTYVQKPPLLKPSNSFNYNSYITAEKNQQPLSFSYGQQTQQQHKHDYETSDTNQRKTFYANTNAKSPMHRIDLHPYANKRIYYKNLDFPASKWNFRNWQQKVSHHHHHSDEAVYSNKDNWWKRSKTHIEKQPQKDLPKWWTNSQKNGERTGSSKRTSRNRKVLNKPPKHRIYPIFGKRRRRRSSNDGQGYFDNDDLAKDLYDIHTKEHLRTRLKLYGKIEKLYKTRGQNGTACVLRALCETERNNVNSYNEEPESFVLELLRSIFAFPINTLANSKQPLLQVDHRYVNAVVQAHDVTQTCSQQYNDCIYSITYNI